MTTSTAPFLGARKIRQNATLDTIAKTYGTLREHIVEPTQEKPFKTARAVAAFIFVTIDKTQRELVEDDLSMSPREMDDALKHVPMYETSDPKVQKILSLFRAQQKGWKPTEETPAQEPVMKPFVMPNITVKTKPPEPPKPPKPVKVSVPKLPLAFKDGPLPDGAQKILAAIEKVTGITLARMRGDEKVVDVVKARIATVYLVKKITGCKTIDIVHMMWKQEVTVSAQLSKAHRVVKERGHPVRDVVVQAAYALKIKLEEL